MPTRDIREIIEEKARKGEGAYAIAFALLDLSDSQEATAKALNRLGNGNASTDFGAIEGLSMQIVQAAEALGGHIETASGAIASALENLELGDK
jgi:hypothetical protein